MSHPIDPTSVPRDVMQRTYKREAPYRHHWPKTFEAAMLDPVVSRILVLLSRHVPAFGRRHVERSQLGLTPPVRETTYSSIAYPTIPPRVTKQQPGIDFKSRAAGERDEPDTIPNDLK
jgi:hypothetical protein